MTAILKHSESYFEKYLQMNKHNKTIILMRPLITRKIFFYVGLKGKKKKTQKIAHDVTHAGEVEEVHASPPQWVRSAVSCQ